MDSYRIDVVTLTLLASIALTGFHFQATPPQAPATPVIPEESKAQHDARMAWWRKSRFGMFIHWGIYSVPSGEWNGKTEYAEWIRESAKIPIDTYNKFQGMFNPVKFNAKDWAKMAHDAGMQYLVITSKHHDGFNMFDSKYTDFKVTNTTGTILTTSHAEAGKLRIDLKPEPISVDLYNISVTMCNKS